MYISSVTNSFIKETIDILKNPEHWNNTGSWSERKFCIVTALWKTQISDKYVGKFRGNVITLIQDVIYKKYGVSRGSVDTRSFRPCIMKFNDHEDTTHEEMLDVLYTAEKLSRPFWFKLVK